MIIVTDLENKITDILKERGNTIVKDNFHVFRDDNITEEHVKDGSIKIGDVYSREGKIVFYQEQ